MENIYKLCKVIPVDGKILDGVSQLGVAPQCGRIWETPGFHRDWLAEKPKCLLEKSCELFFAMVFVAFRWGKMEFSYIFTLIYLWTCKISICIYVVAFGCVSKCCGFEDPSCICSSSLEHQIRFDLYSQERQWNLFFRAAAPALHHFDQLVDNSLSLIPCEIQKKCHQKPAYCSRNDGLSFFALEFIPKSCSIHNEWNCFHL